MNAKCRKDEEEISTFEVSMFMVLQRTLQDSELSLGGPFEVLLDIILNVLIESNRQLVFKSHHIFPFGMFSVCTSGRHDKFQKDEEGNFTFGASMFMVLQWTRTVPWWPIRSLFRY